MDAGSGLPEIPGYRTLGVVGRGGFATVYRAHEESFGRDVAIKVLDANDVSDDAQARFERECRAVGSVSSHPNIVTVFATGSTASGRPYIVMEFLEGGSLGARLKRDGRITPREATQIGLELLDAVTAAHEIGIIHRDIKPDNVLMSRYGRPKLGDFGISSIPGGYETRSGNTAHTMGYAAPEVINGDRATNRSDLYSVAATLATLMIGRAPFARDGDALVAYINRILTEPPPDLRQYGASPELDAVLQRGLSKDPSARYATAVEFRAALAAVPEAHAVAGDSTVPLATVPLATATPAGASAGATAEPAYTVRRESTPRPTVSPTAAPVAPAVTTGRRRRSPLLWLVPAAAVVILAAGSGVAITLGGHHHPAPAPVVPSTSSTPSPVEVSTEPTTSAPPTSTPTPARKHHKRRRSLAPTPTPTPTHVATYAAVPHTSAPAYTPPKTTAPTTYQPAKPGVKHYTPKHP